MSFWNPTEEERERDRQRVEEADRRVKESWAKLRQDMTKSTEKHDKWHEDLDTFLDDPNAVAQLNDTELEHYKIKAEMEIKRCKSNSDVFSKVLPSTKSEGISAIFDLVTGIRSHAIENRQTENEQLIRLINAEQKRRIAIPPAGPGKTEAEKAAERVANIMNQVNELEKQRDSDMKDNPVHAARINQRYRRLIDELLEKL